MLIADFGLCKQLTTEITPDSPIFGMPAYVDSQCYKIQNYKKDKRSDIYSLGVLLWEIRSGYPPFLNITTWNISYKIVNGDRERPIIGTPQFYIDLYQECWKDDPSLRPNIEQVYERLKKLELIFNTNEQLEQSMDNDCYSGSIEHINFLIEKPIGKLKNISVESLQHHEISSTNYLNLIRYSQYITSNYSRLLKI